jgi:hypothetical protein
MQIIHNDGIWLRNNARFALQDPEINHLFQPHELVKIRRSDWAKAQTVIEVVPDPLATAPIITAAAVTKAPAPAIKKVSPV